jgi:hypothetical protein
MAKWSLEWEHPSGKPPDMISAKGSDNPLQLPLAQSSPQRAIAVSQPCFHPYQLPVKPYGHEATSFLICHPVWQLFRECQTASRVSPYEMTTVFVDLD